MQKRKFDELISHFNRKVSDMSIDQKYKMELLGMISAIGFAHENELGTNLAEVGTDAISRQQAIDALRKLREEDIEDYGCEIPEGFNQDHLDRATFAIKQLPTIQPKRGKWIRTGSGSLYDHYECSECGKAPKWECMGNNRWKIAFTDFCPNCGADMRGEQDE